MTRRPRIAKRKRIFVGCEGESEQSYAAFLGRLAQSEGLPVHIDPVNLQPAGDPKALAGKAIAQATKRGRDNPYAFHAALLDADKLSDDPQKASEAKALLGGAGFAMIWQEQDHEALLLRHFPGHHMDNPPRGKTLVALKAQWPDYRKGMAATDLQKVLCLDDVRRAAGVTPELRRLLEAIGL